MNQILIYMPRHFKKYEDFIPKSDLDKLLWLQAYVKKVALAVETSSASLKTNEVTQHKAEVQEYIDAIIDSERKKVDAKAATARKDELEKKVIKRIRDVAALIKRGPTTSEALIAGMGIKCKGYALNLSELQPEISVTLAGNKIHVYFNKNHHYYVAVYCRQPGGEFEHIGNGVTSPFVDERPLKPDVHAERREYQIIYTDSKSNFGLPSSIASIVYGG